MKVTDYKIVEGYSEWGLQTEVKNSLWAGWQPLGGGWCKGERFYQVMVKYDEAKTTQPGIK